MYTEFVKGSIEYDVVLDVLECPTNVFGLDQCTTGLSTMVVHTHAWCVYNHVLLCCWESSSPILTLQLCVLTLECILG